MRMVAGALCAAAGLSSAAAPAAAQAVAVELELVLAVDASGSVSAAEFDLQTRGLAGAFRDPAVIAAIRDAGPDGIVVALMQWSSPGQQVVAVDWTVAYDAASAAALADRIEAAGRLILGETAIDGALRFAAGLIDANRFAGRRRAIDLSGDGQTNWGRDPDPARDRAVAAGITVNGLAIVNEQPDLARYFREHVIGGPGAFVAVAADYDDVAAAIRLKLIQEIRGAPIGLGPPRPTQWARRPRRRGVRRPPAVLDFRPCRANRGKIRMAAPPDRRAGSDEVGFAERRRICAGLAAALLGLAGIGLAACADLTYDSSTGRFKVPLGRGPRDNQR